MAGIDPISNIASLATSIIERVLPDKAAQDQAKLALLTLQQSGELAQITADSQTIQAVNASMQAEAKSEHWLVWSWRPFCGFTLAGLIINNYILCPYFGAFGVKPLDIPVLVWQVLLSVVGVSALTRGVTQAVSAWQSGSQPEAPNTTPAAKS